MQQISKELDLRASYVAPESYVVPILGGGIFNDKWRGR